MPTYTGAADSNGDFNISFGSNSFTSGEKITVVAEKDGATKSIELFAPSDVTGGGVIRFTGNIIDFPNNIGGVVLSEISGRIASYAFYAGDPFSIWGKAISLDIPSTVTSLGSRAFYGWGSCNEIICRAENPPEIQSNTFDGLKTSCIFKVPASSVDAYKTASYWSAFAARIQAI